MKMKPIFLATVFFGLSWLHTVAAVPGDLDTTFSGDGTLSDLFGTAFVVAVQPDGKILAAGTGYNEFDSDFAVARYNPDGSRDTTFGGGTGMVTTGIFYYGYDEVLAIAIQPDGKIVAAGVASTCYEVCALISFAVVRYNPDGSLDTSFGGDGVVVTVIASSDDRPYSVAIQPDGKILVAGRSGASGQTDFTLVRYNTDGTLDSTFDSDGIVRTNIRGDDFGSSLALQSDGKIVVVGESWNGLWGAPNSSPDFAVVRYNPNGSLDTTFGQNGRVTTPMGNYSSNAFSVAIQTDGRIVAAGYSNNGSNLDLAIARYDPDGSLDATFDSDGKVTTAIGTGNEHARSVAIQADGKIVAAGPYSGSLNDDFAVVRYNANGSLDPTFGSGSGKATADFNNSNDNAYGITLDGNGRAVVVGGSNDTFALARFLLAPAQPAMFELTGRVTTSSGSSVAKARVTLTDSAGNIRLALTSPFGYFRFQNVAAGEYTVTVRSKRHGSASSTITVDSSNTNLDLVL
ncbi:MAG: carboxypeptidase regulatory-like domain-containing protein [Acidobacteria bacterium]|nr:carboxypeptidase regulatory-like domain-containing protein [Acidobacteriota bacterium]